MSANLTKLPGLACAILLTSCAGMPAPATQIVQVPVSVPCVSATDIPRRPDLAVEKLKRQRQTVIRFWR
jgi:hypothetical protein